MTPLFPDFKNMSDEDKLKTILCPSSTEAAKTVNKYIGILMMARDKLESGYNIDSLTYPTRPLNCSSNCTEYENLSDTEYFEEILSCSSDSDD